VPVGGNGSPGPGLHAEGPGGTRGGVWGAWEGQKFHNFEALTRAHRDLANGPLSTLWLHVTTFLWSIGYGMALGPMG